MPIDEEQPDFAQQLSDEASRTIQETLVRSGISGALSLVPGIGSAITEMLTELAIQRTNERIKDMFEYFMNRIREVGEGKVDRDWFRSEEFQTLLFEAIHQLHVTSDRDKIQMLGVALANSGSEGFNSDERKDLFIRFVRDLAPQHIRKLADLAPPPIQHDDLPSSFPSGESPSEKIIRMLRWNRRPTETPQGDDLLVLQMLHAYGLVEELLVSPVKGPAIPMGHTTQTEISKAVEAFVEQLQKPPIRSYRISEVGRDFLDFMGLPKTPSA